MLVLTRKAGQSITIQPDPRLDYATPVGLLFSDGPIEVEVKQVGRGSVTLGISANKQLSILRDELQPQPGPTQVEIPANRNCHEILAQNVTTLRAQRKLSIEELAHKSGLALTTILGVEKGQGHIELDDLDRIANSLNVSVSGLLRD